MAEAGESWGEILRLFWQRLKQDRKSLLIALSVLGFILFIVGLVSGSLPLLLIGLFILLIGLALLIPAILRREEVVDNWSVLVEDGQGRAEEIFQDAEEFIRDSKAPGLAIERQKLAPGVLKGIFGVRRDFLVVTPLDNPRLEPFKVYINARDYGKNLDVSWYLTYKPGSFRFRMLRPAVSVERLDLFDQQDLRAYVTNAHHCLLKAVEKLMAELGQDPAKVDRRSRGFLGIS